MILCIDTLYCYFFQEPLNVIHGAKSFNSGKPVPNNSFLYTFDEDGSYTVASQGAPGFFCTIVVLDVGKSNTSYWCVNIF